MAMFDIADSEGVTLNENKTNQEEFAKVRNTRKFSAERNHAKYEKAEPASEIFEMKPSFFGFGVNLKELWRWFKKKLND